MTKFMFYVNWKKIQIICYSYTEANYIVVQMRIKYKLYKANMCM